MATPPGRLVYTQMLNARGGIECDLTVARLAEDAYYIVTGTGFATHDFAWIARHLPEACDARLIDVTSAFAVLSVMGPRARDVLARVTDDDVSNAALPVRHAGARSASPARRCARCASPMSASSAGSCTCRSSWRSPSTTR